MGDTLFSFKIGERHFAKTFQIQKVLPVIMAKYGFTAGRFKATTIIKINGFDDIFVIYGDTLKVVTTLLKSVAPLTKEELETVLTTMAKEYQKVFALQCNSFYGGFPK